jgi:NADPH-dependent glutamate synthase beta subunit-like oxidoreductase
MSPNQTRHLAGGDVTTGSATVTLATGAEKQAAAAVKEYFRIKSRSTTISAVP